MVTAVSAATAKLCREPCGLLRCNIWLPVEAQAKSKVLTASDAQLSPCACSWMGKGVSTAVQNANEIIGPALTVSHLVPVPLRAAMQAWKPPRVTTNTHLALQNSSSHYRMTPETVCGRRMQGMDPTKQKDIDNKMIELDGTDNKVGTGMACAYQHETV